MAASQLDPSREQRHDRLLEAIRKIAPVTELPAGRIDRLPAVREVIDAADDLARRSELEDVLDAVDEASKGFTEAARCVVAVGKMRSDDRLILGQTDDDLRLLRVDFQGDEAEISELDAVLRATPHGSLIMASTRRDEQTSVAFAGEFQFLVYPTAETLEGFERQLVELSTTREIVPYGLRGQLLLTFGLGHRFRGLWGSGTAIVTEQRMLGVIFDDNMQGRPRNAEDAWMPSACVASDVSSVIVFDFPRSCVEGTEVLDKGFLARRVPYANISGAVFAVACDAVRIFDAAERLVRPPKDVLGAALRSLASETAVVDRTTDEAIGQVPDERRPAVANDRAATGADAEHDKAPGEGRSNRRRAGPAGSEPTGAAQYPRDAGSRGADGAQPRVHEARDPAVDARAWRASIEAMLTRIGLRSMSSSGDALVETLTSLVPPGSELVVCMGYHGFVSTRGHQFQARSVRIRRQLPAAMSGSGLPGIDGAPGLPATQVVLCTRDVLMWTSSYFEPGDGVVTDEVVTAILVPFAEILGARVRKKGRVDVWVEAGPTLTFRTTPDEAAELCLSVESLSAAA